MSIQSQTHDLAKKNARLSHKDWLVWKDQKGVLQAEVRSYNSVKKAMLATGTQGYFWLYDALTGQGNHITWVQAVILLRNGKYLGYLDKEQ